MHSSLLSRLVGLFVVLSGLCSLPALASVPQVVSIDGALRSGGGVAPDGNYKIQFALYKDFSGGAALWNELASPVAVKNGTFSWQLDSVNALAPSLLANQPTIFVGVSVGDDPELPRLPLTSTPFALRASLAEGVDCTGCVTLQQIDPKALQGFAKTADLSKVATTGNYGDLAGKPTLATVAQSGNYADLIGIPDLTVFAQAAALAKVATTGQYGDLQGQPNLALYAKSGDLANVAISGNYSDLQQKPIVPKVGEACGSGLVLTGFAADGSYTCVSSLDVNNLPANGLTAVSNKLLTDEIADSVVSTAVPLKIPDYNPKGVSDSVVWPDTGTAEALAISVDLANSDVGKAFSLVLKAPDNSTVTLYDSTQPGGVLKTTFTDKTVLAKGSLSSWVGKNPKGTWTLTVIDNNFTAGGFDGQLNAWSLQVTILSKTKVKAFGGFQFFNAPSNPVVCDATQSGFSYYNTTDKALYICNGTDFFPLSLSVVGAQGNPGVTCKDVLTKMPASKDGVYWINPDGKGAYQAYCDMTTDGGGWTLAMRFKNDAKLGWASAYWTDGNVFNDDGAGSQDPSLNVDAKFAAFLNVPGSTLRGCKGVPAGAQCFQQSTGGSKALQALFNENWKAGGPNRASLVAVFGDDGSQPNCNQTGINNFSSYGGPGTYSAARFGLVGNNEGDCASTDSGWGFGVYGCSNTALSCGAGLATWNSGACPTSCVQGSLWVR